jgi:hypothetical protein
MSQDQEMRVRKYAVEGLVRALEEFGISTMIVGPDTVTALDKSGLSQSITLRSQEGSLMWCWLWPGRKDGDVEAEAMVVVEQIGEAARRIRDVISVTVDRAR